MRIYIDDDSVEANLIRLLRRNRHDVQVPADVGMQGRKDHAHLAFAIRNQRVILTRNYRDFDGLHDLIVVAAQGHHSGIMVVRYDDNPRNNMSVADIARAIRNLEISGTAIPDVYHELNHWQ